jgi:Cytochrome P460
MFMSLIRRPFFLLASCGLLALTLALTLQVRAGGEKVAFPANFDAGVLYATIDRADIKQYRDLYAPAAAVEAAAKGAPLPDGTVLTLVQFKAVLGADGNPVKDANGRFRKGDLVGYTTMEKRAGWGTEYPDTLRNGEWEYQAFKSDKSVNDKANLKGCFECHKPLDKQDFVFSYDRLKTAKK